MSRNPVRWVRITGLILAGAYAGPGNASPGDSSLQGAAALWSVEPLRVVVPPAGAHPVDALLKSAEGPAADRRALMRRVSYGLTGLPPIEIPWSVSWRTSDLTWRPSKVWWRRFSPRPTTASTWVGTGWMWCGMPTPPGRTAITRCLMPGAIETGLSMPSTRMSPMTGLSATSWRAT